VIHGVAFTPSDFRKMRSAAAALVWSPRSNIDLYGSTTDVIAAFREGVFVALAPDWAPTGNRNMLAELQYAAQFNKDQLGGFFSNQQLFEMATSIPARIARIDDKVGSIQVGLYADLFLLRGDATRPFDALMQSTPKDVQLVFVNGVPVYGDSKLMREFNVNTEPVTVCREAKSLNLDVMPNGRLADVQTRMSQKMSAFKIKLTKLDDCP
jgi:cytosine/adenosine deaminase-related metal-dependent hydrolase